MQSALDIDSMHLITLKARDSGFDPARVLSIFDPFDGFVWLATVGMFFVGAVFMWMTEGDRDNEDYKHSHSCVIVCVCRCMYVCMYACMYVWYAPMCLCAYISARFLYVYTSACS